jgi:osmoprotectant transport system substrate-binding protein
VRLRRTIAAYVVALMAAACGTSGHRATPSPTRAGAVVVASFNFSESRLVAEIYAQALENAGVPVHRQLELGPRELVQPAMAQGFVDVVPEYLGSGLRSVGDEATDPGDPVAVRKALRAALEPWSVEVLTPSSAEDQNGFAVTRDRSDALGLHTISDLSAHAATLVLGGPPECPSRPLCMVGLERVYGLRFARFVPLATQAQEQVALDEGVIDVAVVFTTDGRLADPGLVLLDDDRHLQPAENLVPLVSTRAVRRYGNRVIDALDAVSSRLTTENLRFLNWRVDVAGKDPAAEARGWLTRHPLR